MSNARDLIEAESPKGVFRAVTQAEWIGGGLWYKQHDFGSSGGKKRGQVGHVFYGHDQKWHMRDVLGVSNVLACRHSYDTEAEAKAALTAFAFELGLIHEEPLPWRRESLAVIEAENPKDVFRKAVSIPQHDWHLRTWNHKTFLFQDDEGNILEVWLEGAGWQVTLKDPYVARETLTHRVNISDTNTAVRAAKDWATRALRDRSGL